MTVTELKLPPAYRYRPPQHLKSLSVVMLARNQAENIEAAITDALQVASLVADCYEVVIVDSAPILPVNDTRILAQLADAMLFVVRWEKTPRGAAHDAVKALRESQAPLAGAVLSMTDPKRFHYYSFGYAGYAYASAYAKYYEA